MTVIKMALIRFLGGGGREKVWEGDSCPLGPRGCVPGIGSIDVLFCHQNVAVWLGRWCDPDSDNFASRTNR